MATDAAPVTGAEPVTCGPPATLGQPATGGPPATSSRPATLGQPAPDHGSTAPGPTDARPSFRLGNRRPLTGLRAFAVGVVIAFHSDFRALPGAWVGVQVFFVLSGFLITAMLSAEGVRHGRISLAGFYARRGARLLPPLLVTIGLLAVYAAFVHVADAAHRLWGDSLAALFYYADYRQALGHAPFFGYLAQSWSLSVEDQFYLVWSVLLVAAVATGRRRLAYGFAAAGLAASVADRLWLTFHAHPFTGAVFDRIYYAFDTRADALLLGCLLGLLATDGFLEGWGRSALRVLAGAALASAAFLVWICFEARLSTETLVVWWLPTTAVAAGVLIVYALNCPDGLGARLLGVGALVFVGELSYTLYLVHFPVFLALQPQATGWGFWPTEAVRLAIVFAIATASWFLLERPLQRWRQRNAAR